MLRSIFVILLFTVFTCPAWAADCSVVIEGDDYMQFNLKEIAVDSLCKQFTVTLKHTGSLDKQIMGHNWVLSKTKDVDAIGLVGMNLGPDSNYLDTQDKRIIAHTKMIGGGQKTQVSFRLSGLDMEEEYSFFCSFPGHWATMQGRIKFD